MKRKRYSEEKIISILKKHEGLQAARKAVFGGIPWQRCHPAIVAGYGQPTWWSG